MQLINDPPLVSVIITVFNGIYLEEAVASIKNQTYPNIEIVIVDDGSTDDTPKIISELDGVKSIRTVNRGVAHARNRGLKLCNGEFISFIDSDDIWVEDKTEKQVEFLGCNGEFDLIYGRFLNYFQPGAEIPESIDKGKFTDIKNGKLISLGTLMVRNNVFEKSGNFDESLRSGEDLDWFIRIRELGIKIYFNDELVMKRRLHDSNLSYESIKGKSDLLKLLKASIDRKKNQR